MGDLIIDASFEGGGDDMAAALDGALDEGKWMIVKRPDCCPRCRVNDNPFVVPLHPNCHCEAVYLP